MEVSAEWREGKRTSAWEELWRRILSDMKRPATHAKAQEPIVRGLRPGLYLPPDGSERDAE